jgi:primary-amine oxidase
MRSDHLWPVARRAALECLQLGVMIALFGGPAFAQSTVHPLDPLSWEEHFVVLDAMHGSGHVTPSTRYSLITLDEPAKSVVGDWKPGADVPRRAFVIAMDKGRTFEAVVDLNAAAVVSWTEIEGVQPTWLEEEYGSSAAIALENEEFREALRRRGYEDLSRVDCFGTPLGFFGTPEERGRRLASVECTDEWGARNYWPRMIGGTRALVDMVTGEVVEVEDGEVIPVSDADTEFDQASVGPSRDTGAPISVEQPLGPGFEQDGNLVSWQGWSFHHRQDTRVGTIVSTVRYQDGTRNRSVLYQGHLSEIFVPYMDPGSPYYAFNFLDAGEYSAGGLAEPLMRGLDCPDNSVYFDMLVAGSDGKPRVKRDVTCLFERFAGDVAWRKRDEYSENVKESRPRRDLVLRMIAVLGNYDYVLDWVFRQDGTIEVVVGSTGIDMVKSVAERVARSSPEGEAVLASSDPAAGTSASGSGSASGEASGWSADRTDAYGRFIAENLVAINHDHFFSYRLDLDVDGPLNSLEIDRLVTKRLPDDHPRRSVWVVEPTVASSESDAKLRIDYERPALWRVFNPAEANYLGYPTSYQIVPGSNAVSLMDADDYPQMRAGFTDYHLWVTPHRSDERFAAGLYPTLSEPGMGLPAWTDADRPISDTDIVVWYTVGFHHVPRAEDWPVMPTAAKSFELRPYDFFDRNPAIDLPARP